MHLSCFLRLTSSDISEDYSNAERDPLPPSRNSVAECAYQIYKNQGCPAGKDLDHWLLAERLMAPKSASEY